jgi:D-threo-aldose 1-dehydrogenase
VDQIIIPGTNIASSRFIFGTASLFNVGTSKARVELLHAAVDNGFTHFDTAPYYGFGWAEKDLSGILAAYPNVSVTTKVGIYSPGGEMQSSSSVFLRKAFGRFIKSVSRPTIDFTVARAQKSLEGSLQRLRRSHIELFVLHDPDIRLLNTDEWLRWLEDKVSSGQVQNFGLALTSEQLKPFLECGCQLSKVIQLFDSLEHKEADVLVKYGREFQITYGYVSSARTSGSMKTVEKILTNALSRNQNGAIIVSTKQVGRLGQYSRILEKSR